MRKKTMIILGSSIALFIVIAAIILMGLFIPVHGRIKDSYYWSEYDEFDIKKIKTLEKKNSEFKVLQVTDLHYHLPHKTKETDNIVKQLVEENTPDMIVITGDSTFGPTNMLYAKHIVKLFDGFKIPWAIVYGNHDDEGKADKNRLSDIYSASEFGLFENGANNIGGSGNYTVNITLNGLPFYSVIMMDSNTNIPYNGKKEYGAFTPSQVLWYEWLTDGLKSNGYENSMMFFHIPFPEYLDAYEVWERSGFDKTIGSGDKREGVAAAPYNPGMFNKIKEQRNTTHVFAGHDHVNDYSILYQNIVLTYGVKSSRQFYSDDDKIGGTLITVDSNKNVAIDRKYIEL